MNTKKKYKVYETKKRSLFKVLGIRAIEISADTLVIAWLLNLARERVLFLENIFLLSFLITILVDIICISLTYLWERLWLKVDWNRFIYETWLKRKKSLEE